MCGRYALGIRAAYVRYQFQERGMPVEDAPADDEFRQTYNFAPGHQGLVYRSDVPDHGGGFTNNDHADGQDSAESPGENSTLEEPKETRYKLQAMKWGLVPFWTKRNPDYGSMMKTINARDDSLIENRGMWNTMKQKKRCIVVCQGFYEWLKKNGGKEKIPHYVKRKDGQLMCFAGLWDCVQFEGAEQKLYTYTIITTDSNQQLKFLHNRMPVILENGSDQIRTWLDPHRSQWSRELQSLLKPFEGELECYPVSKEVGKVGNDSPAFIIPVASRENKGNIANFFSNAKKSARGTEEKEEIKTEKAEITGNEGKFKQLPDNRPTVEQARSEDNAPIPAPEVAHGASHLKRERVDSPDNLNTPVAKAVKTEANSAGDNVSPVKLADKTTRATGKKSRSATCNGTAIKESAAKASDGSQRITNFFGK